MWFCDIYLPSVVPVVVFDFQGSMVMVQELHNLAPNELVALPPNCESYWPENLICITVMLWSLSHDHTPIVQGTVQTQNSRPCSKKLWQTDQNTSIDLDFSPEDFRPWFNSHPKDFETRSFQVTLLSCCIYATAFKYLCPDCSCSAAFFVPEGSCTYNSRRKSTPNYRVLVQLLLKHIPTTHLEQLPKTCL